MLAVVVRRTLLLMRITRKRFASQQASSEVDGIKEVSGSLLASGYEPYE